MNVTTLGKKISKLIQEMPCPICLGAGSTMSTHRSLSKKQFELSVDDPLRCTHGHLSSALVFNNKDVLLISIMDINKRPVKQLSGVKRHEAHLCNETSTLPRRT